MIAYFQGLGINIEREWLRHSYNEECFPELALELLGSDPPSDNVGPEEIIDWVFCLAQAPRQPNNRRFFGEPPVLLFQSSRFYIEALFWLSGTTAIHEHSFSGAFTVLAGSSVHSHWSFKRRLAVNSRMLWGKLERASTEILRAGDIRPVHSGSRLIHQLFHLDLPSVTIVVRTYEDRHHLPQYEYLLPGLAVDHEDRNGLTMRRMALLDGMARGQVDGLQKYSRRVVESGDLETIYHMFSTLTRRNVGNDLLEILYEAALDRHGSIIELFKQVCNGERRTRLITALRSKVVAPEPRFLLALLMLMPDRESIFDTIQLQFPDTRPMQAIEKWIESISGKDTIGFDFNGVNKIIFRGLMEGINMESILRRLKDEIRDGSVEPNQDRIINHVKKISDSEIFYPLLSRSSFE